MRTAAIIVTYNPKGDLSNLVSSLFSTVDYIIVVDNGSRNFSIVQDDKIWVIKNNQNLGIAKALNIGIEKARELMVDYVVLFDQDSSPCQQTVKELGWVFESLTQKGHQIGGVSPRFINRVTGKLEPFFSYREEVLVADVEFAEEQTYHSDFMITSGALIHIEVLNTVGDFESGLFIDYVDTEWNFRAISKGYHCVGSNSVMMQHELGDSSIWIPFQGKVFLHSPFRVYYQIRNALKLRKRAYMPKRFLTNNLIFHTFLYFWVALIRVDFKYVKSIFNGWKDGILSKDL